MILPRFKGKNTGTFARNWFWTILDNLWKIICFVISCTYLFWFPLKNQLADRSKRTNWFTCGVFFWKLYFYYPCVNLIKRVLEKIVAWLCVPCAKSCPNCNAFVDIHLHVFNDDNLVQFWNFFFDNSQFKQIKTKFNNLINFNQHSTNLVQMYETFDHIEQIFHLPDEGL